MSKQVIRELKQELENFISEWNPDGIEQKALEQVEKINWIKSKS